MSRKLEFLLIVLILSIAGADSQFLQQGGKLIASDPASSDPSLGWSAALSADGNTAIAGGLFDGHTMGAAWVFTRSNGVWSQQGNKLYGTNADQVAYQGYSVALSADGNTAVIGADDDNNEMGAIWVFVRSGQTWTQQGSKLVGSGGVEIVYQGSSVSLSADGNTVIEGGPNDSVGIGASWVFVRSGSAWTQQGSKLISTDQVGQGNQGHAVSISADGNTALVGGPFDEGNKGAAWIYLRSGGVWTQLGSKLVGTGAAGAAAQGVSAAISGDGKTAIVGGNNDNSGAGAAWVFVKNGSSWAQQGAKLVGTGAVGSAAQGSSVSISSDGNTALIGGPGDNGGVGAVWVFTRSNGVWSQSSKIEGTGSSDTSRQGKSVALSSDGSTVIVGGFGDSSATGAVWFFTSPRPIITSVTDVPGDQGGSVNVNWTKSPFDTKPSTLINSYRISRGIRSSGVITWQPIASVPASGLDAYSRTSPTLADSTPGLTPWEFFRVTALTADSNGSWDSSPDSGYSVDNLPPSAPAGASLSIAGSRSVRLKWNRDRIDPDVADYEIHRSVGGGFQVSPLNLIATTTDTTALDTGLASGPTYYYRVVTVDTHGNQSPPSPELSTGGPLSVSVEQALPAAFGLDQNYPDPFNPSTTITYKLPQSAHVTLKVYTLLGQEVATLVDGVQDAGSRSVLWRAENTASGVYFYRIVATYGAGSFSQVRRMLVTK